MDKLNQAQIAAKIAAEKRTHGKIIAKIMRGLDRLRVVIAEESRSRGMLDSYVIENINKLPEGYLTRQHFEKQYELVVFPMVVRIEARQNLLGVGNSAPGNIRRRNVAYGVQRRQALVEARRQAREEDDYEFYKTHKSEEA